MTLLGIFLFVFLTTDLFVRGLIPLLRQAGILGQDRNKLDKPPVPEMGGLALVSGISLGFLLIIALRSFLQVFPGAQMSLLTAVLATVLLVGLIGLVDDLVKISQQVKAATPLLASFPLVALKIGETTLTIPILGTIDLGVFYSLVLVPLGVAGAANAFNMLGGFNGLEVGLGLVAAGTLAIIAFLLKQFTALWIMIVAFAAMLAFLRFNWYPAQVFPGDVGTLCIGALIATGVIAGNFEVAGILLILPHAIDLFLKARSGFPSDGWWGVPDREGKLHCPTSRPVGLCQLIMKLSGGIRERHLVLLLITFEALLGGLGILFYWLKLTHPL